MKQILEALAPHISLSSYESSARLILFEIRSMGELNRITDEVEKKDTSKLKRIDYNSEIHDALLTCPSIIQDELRVIFIKRLRPHEFTLFFHGKTTEAGHLGMIQRLHPQSVSKKIYVLPAITVGFNARNLICVI